MKSLRNEPETAQQRRMAQPQLSTDFLDRALEWRRIFAEAWGTFLLVVVAAGGEVVVKCGVGGPSCPASC
jgi:aquaporin Z